MEPLTTDWLIRQTGCRQTIKIISTSNTFENVNINPEQKYLKTSLSMLRQVLLLQEQVGWENWLINALAFSRSIPQVLPYLLKPLVPKIKTDCLQKNIQKKVRWLWPILGLCVSCQKFDTLALTSYKLWDRRRVLSLRRDRNRNRTSEE